MEPSLEIEDAAGRRRVFFNDGLRLAVSEFGLQPIANGSRVPAVAELSLSPDGLWVLSPTDGVGIELNGEQLAASRPIWPGDRLQMGESKVVVLDREGNAPPVGAFQRAVEANARSWGWRGRKQERRAVFGSRGVQAGPQRLGELEYAAALREESRESLDLARAVAAMIDLLLLAPVWALVGWLFGTANPYSYAVGIAVALSYFFACEWLVGRTVGKRLVGLRVERLDGRSLGANAVAARTFLRLVDYLPALYLVGLVTMSLTRGRRQRVGDLAASTAVVDARVHPQRPLSPDRKRRLGLALSYPAIWLTPALVLAIAVGHVTPFDAYVQRVRSECRAEGQLIAGLGPNATISQLTRADVELIRAEMQPPIPAAAADTASRLQVLQQNIIAWRAQIQSDYNSAAPRSQITTDFAQMNQDMSTTNAELGALGLADCRRTTAGVPDQGANVGYSQPVVRALPARALRSWKLQADVGPGIEALSSDARGGVWATASNGDNQEADALVHITPNHRPQIVWMPHGAGAPAGIAIAADGSVWFTESPLWGVHPRIGRLAAGHMSQYTLPGKYNSPGELIAARGGLWFLDGQNRVGRIVPATHRVKIFKVSPNAYAAPAAGLAAGPDGAVWVARGDGVIELLSVNGSVTAFTAASPKTGIFAITSGADGSAWFSYGMKGIARITRTGKITRYSLPAVIPDSQGLAATGTVIWSQGGGLRGYRAILAGFSPKGRSSFFLLPRGWTSEMALASAGNRTLWIAESDGRIVRVTRP